MKKTLTLLVAVILLIIVSVPVMAFTVYPDDGMSSNASKYYVRTRTTTVRNIYGMTLCTYRFRPAWRISDENSIHATSNASTFTKGNPLSPWKLVASDSSWYGFAKENARFIERYYAEGVVVGWGTNVNGSVGITGGVDEFSASVKTSSSVTIGQTHTYKYQAVATTGNSWTSCDFRHNLYT